MAGFEFPEEGVTPENWDETFRRFTEYEHSIHAYRTQERLLRKLWPFIRGFTAEGIREQPYPSAVRRLLDAGVDPEDLANAMRYAALSAVFGTLVTIDEGHDYYTSLPEGATGWRLLEVRVSEDPDIDGQLTGRDMGGLHESLGSADPSGQGGEGIYD